MFAVEGRIMCCLIGGRRHFLNLYLLSGFSFQTWCNPYLYFLYSPKPTSAPTSLYDSLKKSRSWPSGAYKL